MTKRHPVVIEKNKGKDSVLMILKYKNMVTRKLTQGTWRPLFLVLILLLIHCITLEKSPAFFLTRLSLLYALGEFSYPVLWDISICTQEAI